MPWIPLSAANLRNDEESSRLVEPKPAPLVSSAKAGVGHGIKSVGTVLQDVGLPELGGKISGYGQEMIAANPPQITSLGDIVESPLTALQEGVGQAVASLPPALAGAGLGAAAGGALGGPVGAVIGGGVGAFAPNLVAEYGEIRDKQTETGIDDKGQALLGAAGAAGLETLADMTVAGRFLPRQVREVLPSLAPLPAGAGLIPRLGRAGKAGLIGAGTEAATEAGQTYIERAAGGQDITSPEAHEEAALGAALGGLGGGTIRGGIELVSPTRAQAQPNPLDQFQAEPQLTVQPEPVQPQARPDFEPVQDVAPPDLTDFTVTPEGEVIPTRGAETGPTPPPPPLGPLTRAASRAPMMPGVPYTVMPQLEEAQDAQNVRIDEGRIYPGRDVGGRGAAEGRADLQQQAQEEQIPAQAEQHAAQAEISPAAATEQEGGIVRGGLTAGENLPVTPVQPTGESADERQEGQGQAPRQDAEILGQPATEGRVKADQPVAEPASGPVAEAGRGASPFEPTHELPNGTPVRPNLDDSGKPIKGEWVDADGDIWEDDQAQPIERPESRPPMQVQESAQVAAPAEERTSSEAEGNEVVQIRDVYGKSHFVRRKEFVGDAMLIRRFDRDGKFIGRIHRENIISDDAPTPYFADREIIGIEPTKEHPNGRAFKSQAAAKRFQAQHKLEGTHEVKPYQDGFILSKRGEQPEPAAIDQAAHEAATSPENDLPQPTEAQKEAGNYKKGHVALHGLDITIENPRGSERSGTDKSGKPWRVEMAHHYGYIKRTEGADGDQVDVFIGPNPDSDKVFVVNQVDPSTKRFDEHKVMLGFDNAAAARKGYLANYAKGWKGLGSIEPMSVETFKKELAKGVFRKPVKTQREDIADTETRIPEEAEPAPPQEQDTDDELAKLDKLYVTAREMVGDRADEKIRSILGSATTKAIGWLEFEGDQYRISLEHLFRTGQVNVNIAGDDKKVSRVTRVSDDADLGHAMGALLAAVNEGATIRIDPPQQEKPETEKPRAESKPKETTGSAEDDARLESFRKQIKERKRRGLGDQLASAASQRAYELLEAKAKADPSKWNVGNGVGHRVVGQISRGFRIVEIDPETKLAMIRSVADTGLTTSGGNADRIEDSWVHIASLVRDRKYDAPAAQPELDEATEQPTEAAQSEPEKPTAPRAKSPRMTLAEKLAKRLEDGETISSKTLFADADAAFGGTQAEGTYSPKDAYDAMEAAVNLYIMLNEPAKAHGAVSAVSAADQAERLHELTKRLPTQTRRDEEMDEFQQFSTPPALAYVANWSANIKPTDTMMEPSAGTGDLAVWARNADANLILNELSKRRAELLRELFPKARVFTENAEQLNNVLPADARPTVVVMNPPFSATAGRKKGERKTSHGAQHIEQALKRLQPGGRLVAIVGEGMAMDRPAFRAWWDKIKNEYNVRANIGISGKTYAKYGTTFDNQILVIDKTGPTTGDVITGNVERPSELPGILEDIRNDRVDTQAADELSQTREPEAAEPGGRREAEPGIAEPVRAERDQPDAVGAGQREARDTERGRTPGEVAEPGATEPEGGLAVSGRPGEDGRRGDIGGRTAADEDAGRGRGVSPGSAAQRDDGDERSATDVIQPSESSPAPKVVDDGVTFDVVAETPKAETPFTESVFEQYTPQKVKVKGAKPHPGKLVQSAAMAAVEPPAPNYTPKLPKEVIEQGLLSDAQLEAVVYAGQAHTEFLPSGVRRGFFIGDGTGVGKGREISGIILDNQRQGRDKAVWISFNEGLINDAKRDFKGIGGDEGQIFWHGKTKAADPITAKKGILFTTYSTLRGGEKKQASETDQKKGKTRVQQIAEWLGKDFDGVIVFDEAHKMGNAVQVKGKRGTSKPSQQALAGIELQAELPKARVVYVSATGATEVMNLAYASRLGLWGEGTPFANVADFISDVSEGGVAAMELVSRDMKALGMYLARSLSYDGVTYDRLEHELTPLQHDVYNELAKAWQTVLHNVNLALEETGQGQNADAKSAAMSRFWGSHQRFFNQVITSLMTPSVIDDIRKQIMAGNAVVIQLTNTNEAEQERQAARAAATETPLEEMDFTPRQALMEYIRTGFPVQQFEEYEDEDGNTRTRPVTDASGNPVFNQDMVARRDNLLRTLEQIRVPDNPIDEIINAFGSDMVAEVTGRGRRFVRERDDKGSWTLVEQKRGPQAARADATAFQGDRKKILIFSDAGGTGYSFHADNTAVNQRRRIHYILQPGWRADGAVQGFGRTHRTNQASAPHYVLPTTNLKAQKRFVSSIARRLDQLGALTRGQRDASSQGLFTAADNLESEYAQEALFNFFDDLYNGKTPLDPMATLEAMGLEGIVDKKTGGLNSSKMPTVPKFLNRLLSLTQEQQDQVFDEFMQRLDDVVRYAIDQGTYDTGLETLTAQSIKKASEEVVHTDERTGAKTRLVELDVTNPVQYVTFKEAQKAQVSMLGEFKGWFRNEKTGQVFGLMDQGKRLVGGDKEEERGIMLTLRGRRYINKVSRILSGKDYKRIGGAYKEVKTFSKLEESEAKALWEEQRKAAPKTETVRYGMLVGAILPIWNRVTGTPKIFRTQTDDGERFLGRLLTKKDAEKTMRNLGIGSDAAKLSTAEQYEAIEKGARAILANEWEIAPAMVSGERRLEIIPGRAYLTRAEQELLTRQGVFVERINWQERFFIPRGEKGPEVFARVVADKPVVELAGRDQREAQEDDDEVEERFSRTRPAESIPAKGVSVREAQSVIAEIQKALPGTAPVSIRVVESQSEIEGAPTNSLVEAVIRMRGPRAELTVVAGNIGTADDLVKVVREELVGHFGLRNLMGSEFNSLMDDIKAAARVNPNVAKMWRELSGRDPKTGETVNRNADYFGDPDAVIADELISKLARGKSRLPILKRIYQKLMAWLRKVGLVRGPMNVWELEGLVARSESALRKSNLSEIPKSSPAGERFSAVALAGADESRQKLAERLWQRLGTDSPYFKRWFKDSKIRKAGKPMVVYHGTNTDIAAFDKGVLGDATRHSTAGLGFFFATDLDAAATYAEKATRARGGRETVGGYYLSIQNPYVVTSELLDRRMGNLSAAEFRAKLERAGHDGIYVKDAGYIVAFEPEQVKSIENVGTFDPMEAEVRYSRRTPDTGEPIDPVDPNAAPRFEQRLRDITVSDVKTLGGDLLERFRPIGLQALGRRQIVDVYGEAVPALHEYDRLAQAYAADSNKTQQDADKVAQDWGKLERKTADKLADIMHQSTLNGVDVSQSEYAPKWTDEAVSQDFNEELAAALKEKRRLQTLIKSVPGGAKAELWERLEAVSKTVERMSKPWSKKAFTKKRQAEEAARKAAYNRLRPEFTALPKEAQAIYTKARDMYSAHWKAVEQALVDRIERSEAVESEKRRIIDQLRLRFRKQLPDIYFPLHRTGDYVIVVKNADGMNEAVMFAETPRQAKKLRAELMRRYAGTDKQVMPIGKKKEKSAQDMVSGRFVSEVLGLIGEAGQGAKMDALREQVVQLYLESLPDLSWAKHELHRKGTPGYSRDARRAFAAHMFHGAAHLSRIRYADRLESSLDRMQTQVDERRYDEGFDAVRAQDVVNEMKKRHDVMMNPPNTPLANLLTSAGFIWYMGLSPASAIVNLSQTPLVAFPVLGGHFGFRKAARSLTKASADITRALAGGGWFKDETAILDRLKSVLAPDEYAVIQKGIEEGHISVTLAHELAGISQGAEQNPAARTIMRGASWMFHTAEMFNRMSTVLAGYRMGRNAIDSTAGYDKSAYGTAIKLNYDSHFDYAACVDDATEMLTTAGWKKRSDLRVGDIAIATDKAGRAVESKVLAVNVYEGEYEVIEFSGEGKFNMVLTTNHDAVIQCYSSRDKKWQPVRKVRADSLKPHHFVLRTPLAPVDRAGIGIGEDLAALLGWIAAEGWYSKYRNCKNANDVRIGQSMTKNPEYVSELRGLLDRMGGEYKEYTYKRKKDIFTTFVLRRSLGKLIQEHLPEKVLTPKLVESMSTNEMRAFIMAFLKGDGTRRQDGKRAWYVGQKNGANLDLLHAMATMCGMHASLSPVNGNGMAVLYVDYDANACRSHVRPLKQVRRTESLVWCPTTECGTWIARRNGTVFVTGNSNRPRAMQGPVARVVLLFKQYAQNMIYLLARNGMEGLAAANDFLRGRPISEKRKAAAKVFGGILAMHAMAAGAFGLPFVGTLLAALSWLGSDDDEPWDAEVALRNYLADTIGARPAEALVHGLPRLARDAVPADISRRVGLDNLLFPDVQEGLEGDKWYQAAATAALGPVAGIGLNIAKGAQTMAEGETWRGVEEMLPKALKDILKTGRFAREGVIDKTGLSILDDTTFGEELAQVAGFSPARVLEAFESRSAVYGADRRLEARRRQLMAQWSKARMDRDISGVQETMQEIREFNQKNPERRITMDSLNRSFKNRQIRIREAESGIYLPRTRRGRLEEGRFFEDF